MYLYCLRGEKMVSLLRGDEEMKKEAAERKAAYDKQYDKDNTTQVKFKLNNRTDEDILTFLNSLPNKQGYIKALIREDMKKRDTD